MKLTIILSILILGLVIGTPVCMAKIKRENNKFKAEETTKSSAYITDYSWETRDKKEYKVYLNSKGKFYIMKVSSKTDKEYIYYLPKEAQEELKKAFIQDNPYMKDYFK